MRGEAAKRRKIVAAPAETNVGFLPWATLVVPLLAAVFVFQSTTDYGFIWDDPLVLQQIAEMKSFGDVLVPPDVVPKFYYRPVIFLTFLLDQSLGGGQPYWFHLSVVAWHVFVTGLVYVFALQLFGRGFFLEAGVAALLFATHPIHVESIAWIAGRSDVIATAFVVLAVMLAAGRAWWNALASALCLLLGMLAKEVAMAGVFLVPARDWLIDRRLRWTFYLPLGAAVGIYLLMRNAGLGAVDTGLATGASAGDNLYDLLSAIGWYTAKTPVPFRSSAYVPDIPANPFYASLGLALLLVTAAAVVTGRFGILAFLLVWFVLTLAPSLLVIVRRSASAVLAERYLYLPTVGAALLLGWGLVTLRSVSAGAWKIAVALLVPVAMLAGVESAARSEVWEDDLTFWNDVVQRTPYHSMPRRELASAYMNRQRLAEAERELKAALELPSSTQDRVMTYNNLGNIHLRRGDLDAAAAAFEAGLALYPHNYLLNGLGRTAMKRAERAQERGDQAEVVKQVRAARRALEQALARDPDDYKSHVLLGQVLFSLRDRAGAQRHLELALRIEPRGPIADTARQYLRQLNAGG